MNKRWMWVICLVAVAVLMTGTSALFAKSDDHEEEVSGSVAIPSEEAMLAKMAKVTLVEAVGAAVKGTPGKAISAELEDEDGFLVYAVEIVGDDNKVTEVTVDAGNKKILKTEVQDDEDEDEDEGGKCDVRGNHWRKKWEHKGGGEED